MMINKRLIGTVAGSKRYIAGNVAFQWLSLAANILLMGAIARLLQALYEGSLTGRGLAVTAAVAAVAVDMVVQDETVRLKVVKVTEKCLAVAEAVIQLRDKMQPHYEVETAVMV